MLLADGYDKAFIGFADRVNQPRLAIYDKNKCIELLMKDGMDMEEATEYFMYNTEGAWVGEETPIFLNPMSLKDYLELYDYKEHSNDN
jgi:hypothetical protein|tara:strand:+ start:411 stop:674 length:264 start_codon:yes stop_codon:yes gene_type:complete